MSDITGELKIKQMQNFWELVYKKSDKTIFKGAMYKEEFKKFYICSKLGQTEEKRIPKLGKNIEERYNA